MAGVLTEAVREGEGSEDGAAKKNEDKKSEAKADKLCSFEGGSFAPQAVQTRHRNRIVHSPRSA